MSKLPDNPPLPDAESAPDRPQRLAPLEQLTVKLLRARKAIILACSSIALLTFLLVYLFETPMQTASLRFFIMSNDAVSPTELLESGTDVFGDPTQTDFHLLHLQSFGTSDSVLLKAVDNLGLVAHYGLAGSYARLDAANILEDHTLIEITYNKELLVEVRDRDIDVAQAAANIIMNDINRLNNEHLTGKITYTEQVCEKQLSYFNHKRTTLLDSLAQLERNLDAATVEFYDHYKAGMRGHQLPTSGNAATMKSNYLLAQLGEVDREISFYENQLIQSSITRDLVAEKEPLVIRQSSPQRQEQQMARAALWGGVSAVWVLGLFVVFFWLRLAFDAYTETFEAEK